jgi:hypothetical protein
MTPFPLDSTLSFQPNGQTAHPSPLPGSQAGVDTKPRPPA